jgi:ribosomal protein L24
MAGDIDTENCNGTDPYFKTTPSTPTGLKGEKGEKGDKGETGAVTTVLENASLTVIGGNLYINNVNTDIRVEVPDSVDVPVMSSFSWTGADDILRIKSKVIRTVAGVLMVDAEGDEVEIPLNPDNSEWSAVITSITESDGTVTINGFNVRTLEGTLEVSPSTELLTFDLGGGVPAGYEEINLEICVSGSPVTRTFLVKTLP